MTINDGFDGFLAEMAAQLPPEALQALRDRALEHIVSSAPPHELMIDSVCRLVVNKRQFDQLGKGEDDRKIAYLASFFGIAQILDALICKYPEQFAAPMDVAQRFQDRLHAVPELFRA